MDDLLIKDFLKTKKKYLYHREGQELEFKEQFNLAGLADYFRDFAAFANNRGGYLIFGVKNAPRFPTGLNPSSLIQFEKIDPEKISGHLLDIFSADIRWAQQVIEVSKKIFGVFYVYEAFNKPIIAKKDEGKDQIIKNGEIYYRYGGRTQKIQHAELESIIRKRVDASNREWLDLMAKIGKIGPSNAAILDTAKGLIEKNESQVLMLDQHLIDKLKFVREGDFVEGKGKTALKLVGDIFPANTVEVVRKVKENLLKEYPLSALELVAEIKNKLPNIGNNLVWAAIKENDIKNNPDYAVLNFRNKKQEDEYRQSGKLVAGIPCIYNQQAVHFLVNVLKAESK
jgi:hypothetical protein